MAPSKCNSSEVNSKFLYCGKGASRWLSLCSKHDDPNELSNIQVKNFLASNINEINFPHKDIQLLVIGCSNLEKEIPYIERLAKKYYIPLFAVDFSKELLNIALVNANKLRLKEFKAIQADFTSNSFFERFKEIRNDKVSLSVFFLGYTFCNYSTSISIQCLNEITIPGDLIVVDVCIRIDASKATKTDLDRSEISLSSHERAQFISHGKYSPEKGIHLEARNTINEDNSLVTDFYLSDNYLACSNGNSTIKTLTIHKLDYSRLMHTFSKHGYELIDKLQIGSKFVTMLVRRR